MSAPKVFTCRYFGGSEAQLQTQADELAKYGISIEANPQDISYCSYKLDGKAEFLGRASFFNPYFHTERAESPTLEAAEFLLLSIGVLKEIPKQFPRNFITEDTVVLEYTVVMQREASLNSASDEDAVKSLVLGKMREKYPEANLLAFVERSGRNGKNQNFKVLVGGTGFDFSEDEQPISSQDIPNSTAYCPEWTTHNPVNDITPAIDGWRITTRPSGAYWAFPLDETKVKMGEYLGQRQKYAYDLQNKLAQHPMLRGDNPKLGLRDSGIRFIGSNGVEGLECPVFEIELVKFPKQADKCVEWAEAKTRAEISADGKQFIPAKTGNFIYDPKQPERIRYIGAETDLNPGNLARVAKKFADKVGFEKSVFLKRITTDEVCSEWELEPRYTAINQPPLAAIEGPKQVTFRQDDPRTILLHGIGTDPDDADQDRLSYVWDVSVSGHPLPFTTDESEEHIQLQVDGYGCMQIDVMLTVTDPAGLSAIAEHSVSTDSDWDSPAPAVVTAPPSRPPQTNIPNFDKLSGPGKDKAKKLQELGPVTVLESKDEFLNAIDQILDEKKLLRQDLCFVVDQSGSMFDNINEVRDSLGSVAVRMMSSSVNNNLCLVSYVDETLDIHHNIDHSRTLKEDVREVRAKLAMILGSLHGRHEYVAEAIAKAVTAWDGVEPIAAVVNGEIKERRLIVVVTDEKGDFKSDGETIASAKAKAAAIGAEVQILMLKQLPSLGFDRPMKIF